MYSMMKQKSRFENPKVLYGLVSKVWFADCPGILECLSFSFPPWEVPYGN